MWRWIIGKRLRIVVDLAGRTTGSIAASHRSGYWQMRLDVHVRLEKEAIRCRPHLQLFDRVLGWSHQITLEPRGQILIVHHVHVTVG
uniref:Putative secreted peptide n=1 Tax=Anopheles braziliensis TaxID=58242 RepID=A0A2M3ZN87_9DIPT